MPTIYHDFTIRVSKEIVFETISLPDGLINWWTLRCSGKPALLEAYIFYF